MWLAALRALISQGNYQNWESDPSCTNLSSERSSGHLRKGSASNMSCDLNGAIHKVWSVTNIQKPSLGFYVITTFILFYFLSYQCIHDRAQRRLNQFLALQKTLHAINGLRRSQMLYT